jgi:large subunit ribosomal protein L25
MEQKTLTITLRDEQEVGNKGANRRLRRTGKIPAVIYGHKGPLSVAVDESEFATQFHRISENTIVQLTGDNTPHDVLVRDFQTDVISGKITHIDFYEIDQSKTLHTRVPIHLHGVPVGVKEGGLLETFVHELDVECLPKDIPHTIDLDVEGLSMGQSLHVEDIPPMPGVKIINSKEQVICIVVQKRAVEEAPAAVAAATEETEAAAETETPEEEE